MNSEAVDWLRWAFSNPFNDGPGMLTLALIVGGLSLWLGFFVRTMEWMGAAAMAAMVGSFFYFMVFTITHRFGPLSLMGLGMMFLLGMMIALPTVGVIRAVQRWMGLKPGHSE
jgi:hypothetical protein